MRPRDAYMSIPTLKIGTTEVTDNREKAEAFLEAFFPEMADPEEEEPGLWQRNCRRNRLLNRRSTGHLELLRGPQPLAEMASPRWYGNTCGYN